MAHRGPDGHGVFEHSVADNYLGLVHRRLSIIDINSGWNKTHHFWFTRPRV